MAQDDESAELGGHHLRAPYRAVQNALVEDADELRGCVAVEDPLALHAQFDAAAYLLLREVGAEAFDEGAGVLGGLEEFGDDHGAEVGDPVAVRLKGEHLAGLRVEGVVVLVPPALLPGVP